MQPLRRPNPQNISQLLTLSLLARIRQSSEQTVVEHALGSGAYLLRIPTATGTLNYIRSRGETEEVDSIAQLFPHLVTHPKVIDNLSLLNPAVGAAQQHYGDVNTMIDTMGEFEYFTGSPAGIRTHDRLKGQAALDLTDRVENHWYHANGQNPEMQRVDHIYVLENGQLVSPGYDNSYMRAEANMASGDPALIAMISRPVVVPYAQIDREAI